MNEQLKELCQQYLDGQHSDKQFAEQVNAIVYVDEQEDDGSKDQPLDREDIVLTLQCIYTHVFNEADGFDFSTDSRILDRIIYYHGDDNLGEAIADMIAEEFELYMDFDLDQAKGLTFQQVIDYIMTLGPT